MADARIDPLLNKLMVKAKATDQLQVVVSFKQSGPVTPAQVSAVRSVCQCFFDCSKCLL